ncbi:hypothetical protein BUALT_Bualt12G0101100 [Buddleja alternifolia]|uniref:F-box domain-containing protein n=1 Tax=Buddleja alternifolia TaxID=168488 RepID=A0AAV6WYK0_9LAMI|nr:hypothetical protein BUALT_Bualt12G0101100 [Buddleja alternifolia]
MDPFTRLPNDFVYKILFRTSLLDASRYAVIKSGFKSSVESDIKLQKSSSMDPFRRLSEDCVCEILSRTSQLDASRCAVISKGFNSAVESDIVWHKFLPSDYSEIVSRSVSPVVYRNNKELYFTLCHSPILLDAGKLSFSLEKRSGKKCYMIGAKELSIAWGETPMYWKWPSHTDSRFSEVALLRFVCWLDIRGKIETQMLSPNTLYGAYLVFKLTERAYGLESAKSIVRVVNDEADCDAEERASYVQLQGEGVPVRRGDGWMEIEMGNIYNDEGGDGEVEARLIEIWELHGKSGLIVEGIEFRPKMPPVGF